MFLFFNFNNNVGFRVVWSNLTSLDGIDKNMESSLPPQTSLSWHGCFTSKSFYHLHNHHHHHDHYHNHHDMGVLPWNHCIIIIIIIITITIIIIIIKTWVFYLDKRADIGWLVLFVRLTVVCRVPATLLFLGSRHSHCKHQPL